mmetsp:Transcript_28518/g.92080  ORF Transcript_28518/g.92080 Transcript_28518/m.92080 type:complete len:252 (-) Transcript_28518:564-1319(-)
MWLSWAARLGHMVSESKSTCSGRRCARSASDSSETPSDGETPSDSETPSGAVAWSCSGGARLPEAVAVVVCPGGNRLNRNVSLTPLGERVRSAAWSGGMGGSPASAMASAEVATMNGNGEPRNGQPDARDPSRAAAAMLLFVAAGGWSGAVAGAQSRRREGARSGRCATTAASPVPANSMPSSARRTENRTSSTRCCEKTPSRSSEAVAAMVKGPAASRHAAVRMLAAVRALGISTHRDRPARKALKAGYE